MKQPPSAPDPADWMTAFVRGLHPIRWGLCLAGLALTWFCAAIAQWFFDGQSPRWAGWMEDPVGHARALGEEVMGRGPGAVAIRLGPVLAVVTAGWCLVGGWIARHELLARRQVRPSWEDHRLKPTATGLVVTQAKQLALVCPTVLAILAALLVPILLAGRLNDWLGGLGAILVAVVLPVILIADVLLLLIGFGALAWPLMPVTIAAENSDTFDALSRAYNYAFDNPIRFVFLLAISLAMAAVPLVAMLAVYPHPMAVGLAAAASFSVFWSLQTLAYLHLRTAVDETDANELAEEPEPEAVPEGEAPRQGDAKPEAPPKGKTKRTKPPTLGFHLRSTILIALLLTATWVVTAWLFERTGGEEAEWLQWGLVDGFVPPAAGLRKVASVIALIWGVTWLSAPFLVTAHRLLRADGPGTEVKRDGDARPDVQSESN